MGKGHTGTKGRKKSSIPKRLHPSGLIQPLHMIQTNYRPQPRSRGCDRRYRHPEKDLGLPDLNRDKPDFRETALDCHTSPLGL